MNEESKPVRLSVRDHGLNVGRAALQAVPYLGGTLDQFIFGALEELRLKRIESTLAEMAEQLRQRAGVHHVATEDFVNLLEAIAPALARATNEDKRQRFRDLLTNAAQQPPGDPAWEDARLAARLLEELDGPALAVLAAAARSTHEYVTLWVSPTPRAYDGEVRPEAIIHQLPEAEVPFTELHYSWPAIEEWIRRLYDMRLIGLRGMDARGGATITLAGLGRFLVRWTTTVP